MTKEELKIYKPKYKDGNIYMTDNDIEHCVMYGNEIEFIKESVRLICEKIKPKLVIEFGFGLGFTAQQFQDEGVETHIIYEPNDFIFKEAEKWAKEKTGVRVINSRFQDNPISDKVDLVYNDIYGMCNEYYSIADYEDVIEKEFNFEWYAEFCVDCADEVPKDYFRFQIGEHDKLQMLVKKYGN
jgi:hypothetical protein